MVLFGGSGEGEEARRDTSSKGKEGEERKAGKKGRSLNLLPTFSISNNAVFIDVRLNNSFKVLSLLTTC